MKMIKYQGYTPCAVNIKHRYNQFPGEKINIAETLKLVKEQIGSDDESTNSTK